MGTIRYVGGIYEVGSLIMEAENSHCFLFAR